jgi:flagellar basal body-associated protein FliL
MKALIIIVIVVAALVGGVLTLRSSRNAGMPGPDVLDRAKARGREQDAKDKSEAAKDE